MIFHVAAFDHHIRTCQTAIQVFQTLWSHTLACKCRAWFMRLLTTANEHDLWTGVRLLMRRALRIGSIISLVNIGFLTGCSRSVGQYPFWRSRISNTIYNDKKKEEEEEEKKKKCCPEPQVREFCVASFPIVSAPNSWLRPLERDWSHLVTIPVRNPHVKIGDHATVAALIFWGLKIKGGRSTRSPFVGKDSQRKSPRICLGVAAFFVRCGV